MASLLRSPLPRGLNLAASTSDHEAFAGFSTSSVRALKISDSPLILRRSRNAHLRILRFDEKRVYVTEASKEPSGSSQEIIDTVVDPFKELEYRFLDFKRRNYVGNLVNYQNLAQQQAPKFMVIACADSRVCPTSILGFQPGEAFTVRNVANLVPPFQHGASETNAALEFAVNSLEVPNILVVGHSRCGGIQALMSMKDNAESSSFIRDWVSVGKSARLSTKAAAGGMSFEKQCRHCEKVLPLFLHRDIASYDREDTKMQVYLYYFSLQLLFRSGYRYYNDLVLNLFRFQQGFVRQLVRSVGQQSCFFSFEKQESINGSLLNLLTYPWIEKRVTEGALALHGCYYDFVNCNFEKWTLVYREGLEGGSKYAIKDRCLWS